MILSATNFRNLCRLIFNGYLRTDAVPAAIFIRDMFAYCALAFALCTALASTADTLLKLLAAITKEKWGQRQFLQLVLSAKFENKKNLLIFFSNKKQNTKKNTEKEQALNLWEVPDGQLEFRFGFETILATTELARAAKYSPDSPCSRWVSQQLFFIYENPKVKARHERLFMLKEIS